MKELYSSRRRPFAARRLVLGTFAVVAALAAIAGVARWRAAPPETVASVPVQIDALARPAGGVVRADPAIASVERADAPSGLADAPYERADVARAPDAPRADDAGAPPAHAGEPPVRPDPSYLPPRVEAYARDAVDRFIDAAGLEEQLGESEREALVTALGEMRASSRWLGRHPEAGGEDEARRQALLDADRVFREMLGVRLGEFVTALAPPGTVEDLGADRR